MNSSSLKFVRQKLPGRPLSEVIWPWLLHTMKTMMVGSIGLMVFIVSPVWNSVERMKKLTHFLMFSLMGLLILWALFWVGQRPVFSIEQIQIQSQNNQNLKHINQRLIRTQILSKLSGNFFSVRLNETRKVFESLPWVRAASVRRVWPNRLSVMIEEYEPIGSWESADGTKLMDRHGEVFTVNMAEADSHKNLLEFSGPQNSNPEVIEMYELLNEWFTPLNAKVIALYLSPRYSWTTKLDNGMTFELGRDLDPKDRSQIKARLDRFFTYWPQIKEKIANKIDYVDLRYSNGFAIRKTNKQEISANKESSHLEMVHDVLLDEKPSKSKTSQRAEQNLNGLTHASVKVTHAHQDQKNHEEIVKKTHSKKLKEPKDVKKTRKKEKSKNQ